MLRRGAPRAPKSAAAAAKGACGLHRKPAGQRPTRPHTTLVGRGTITAAVLDRDAAPRGERPHTRRVGDAPR